MLVAIGWTRPEAVFNMPDDVVTKLTFNSSPADGWCVTNAVVGRCQS